jgi:thiol-disulfide isomerase/thioredoxin
MISLRSSGPTRVLLVAFLLALAGRPSAAGDTSFRTSLAPAISVNDREGHVRTLSEFKGRVVLVDFWASWCAPCKVSFPALDALHEEFHDAGLEVVAINVDEDAKSARAFLSGKSPSMTVLFDPKGRSPEAFKVEGMPSSFLIDREGNIRFRHMGFTDQTRTDFRREIKILLGEGADHASK